MLLRPRVQRRAARAHVVRSPLDFGKYVGREEQTSKVRKISLHWSFPVSDRGASRERESDMFHSMAALSRVRFQR